MGSSPKQRQKHVKESQQKTGGDSTFISILKLSRPKFLYYSLFLHSTGVLVAWKQNGDNFSFDFYTSFLLQLTISITHLGTHFWNEWGDYEVDILNENAGAWTGGSKVLKSGALKRKTAWNLGCFCLILSLLGGFFTLSRFLEVREGVVVGVEGGVREGVVLGWVETLLLLPFDFVFLGFSVLFVAFAYSVPPLRLCARGMGEVCVSYVLTFCGPAVGLIIQGGTVNMLYFYHIFPLFVINGARMIVMNIPDKEGDAKGDKLTSVVLIGEEKAVILNNILYAFTFVYLVPSLPDLSFSVRMAYEMLVPIRWGLSLHLNQDKWWNDKVCTDLYPFYESLFVVISVIALNCGLIAELSSY